MVLDLPRVVDADAVGEFDLFQRLAIDSVFSISVPGSRNLVFVKDTELHLFYLLRSRPGHASSHISGFRGISGARVMCGECAKRSAPRRVQHGALARPAGEVRSKNATIWWPARSPQVSRVGLMRFRSRRRRARKRSCWKLL